MLVSMTFLKKSIWEKFFFWKYWEKKVPGKTEYPENHENSETFFSWIFPKIKFSTSSRKKN